MTQTQKDAVRTLASMGAFLTVGALAVAGIYGVLMGVFVAACAWVGC